MELPVLSVIIPVYNDPEGIAHTLRSVIRQEAPRYEVIPVDNASTDATPTVIERWKRRHPDLIRPTEEREVQSSYAARNAGIEKAQGEITVFIDANMTAPNGWLEAIESEISSKGYDYLGYEVDIYVPEEEEGWWGWYDRVMGLPSRYHYEQKHFVPTSSLAVRSKIFDEVGAFDKRLFSGGDKEFGQRVHSHPQLKMGFSDDIVVYHPARTTFAEHSKKALRIGYGMAQLYDQSISPSSDSIRAELIHHALPPDPFRLYEKDVEGYKYPLLYLSNLIIRYIRLCGMISYFLGTDRR